jgi:FdhD protein
MIFQQMKQHLEPVEITRFAHGKREYRVDLVSVESPIGIRLIHGPADHRTVQDVAITMRTPGNDVALALGFLFSEGILHHKNMLEKVEELTDADDVWVQVFVKPEYEIDTQKLVRHFYTTSSCGVCGKSSLEAVKYACTVVLPQKKWKVSQEMMVQLPEKLRKAQEHFEFSGGIHAAALFDLKGNLIDLQEDVGRHNALDKLLGMRFQHEQIPLLDHVLVLSGRASFELLQKSAMAGIRMVCAIGAPSSLALALAETYDITLVGFLKADRFNVYHAPERIQD